MPLLVSVNNAHDNWVKSKCKYLDEKFDIGQQTGHKMDPGSESQTDWFAKRGISWHISVVARKHQGNLQSQSFVHIVENCDQKFRR